jgi:hypothetical protein
MWFRHRAHSIVGRAAIIVAADIGSSDPALAMPTPEAAQPRGIAAFAADGGAVLGL